MENNLCLRKELERKMPVSNAFSRAIILLGCSFCYQLKNHQNIERYTRLLIAPLLLSFRRDYESSFYRAFGSYFIEETIPLFCDNEVADEDMAQYLMKCGAYQKDTLWINDFINSAPIGIYCKLLAHLYYDAQYDMLYSLSMLYASQHLNGDEGSFRLNMRFDGKHFFQIGVSLDEGFTESLTLEMAGSYAERHPDAPIIGDALRRGTLQSDSYFFEVRFFKKILTIFNIKWPELVADIWLEHKGLDILFEGTKSDNACDLFNLLYLSDHQKWKEANSILEGIKKRREQ